MNANTRICTFLASLTTGFLPLGCAHLPVPPYTVSELCQPTTSPGDAAGPLLIEDAENGDNQVIVHDVRNGYLYTFVDTHSQLAGGSTVAGAKTVPLVGGQGRCKIPCSSRRRRVKRTVTLNPFFSASTFAARTSPLDSSPRLRRKCNISFDIIA
jgi:hypothetical protein